MGIGFIGEPDKKLNRLFPMPDLTASLYLIVHVDMRRNARVRAFVEHTYASLVPLRPLFEGSGLR